MLSYTQFDIAFLKISDLAAFCMQIQFYEKFYPRAHWEFVAWSPALNAVFVSENVS